MVTVQSALCTCCKLWLTSHVKQRSGRDASSHHEVVLHGLMPVTGSRRLNCYDKA